MKSGYESSEVKPVHFTQMTNSYNFKLHITFCQKTTVGCSPWKWGTKTRKKKGLWNRRLNCSREVKGPCGAAMTRSQQWLLGGANQSRWAGGQSLRRDFASKAWNWQNGYNTWYETVIESWNIFGECLYNWQIFQYSINVNSETHAHKPDRQK